MVNLGNAASVRNIATSSKQDLHQKRLGARMRWINRFTLKYIGSTGIS